MNPPAEGDGGEGAPREGKNWQRGLLTCLGDVAHQDGEPVCPGSFEE